MTPAELEQRVFILTKRKYPGMADYLRRRIVDDMVFASGGTTESISVWLNNIEPDTRAELEGIQL